MVVQLQRRNHPTRDSANLHRALHEYIAEHGVANLSREIRLHLRLQKRITKIERTIAANHALLDQLNRTVNPMYHDIWDDDDE